MQFDSLLDEIMKDAFQLAKDSRYEYISPEMVLLSAVDFNAFADAFEDCGGNADILEKDLIDYLITYMESSASPIHLPEASVGLANAILYAQQQAAASSSPEIKLSHLLKAFWQLKDSYAIYFMEKQGVQQVDMIRAMTEMEKDLPMEEDYSFGPAPRAGSPKDEVKLYAPCINDMLDNVNPLIGREEELERTIQILCRKDKNNPLHIGEPGVGKTAITYGLARLINENKVPKDLQGARIFSLDLSSVLAGTQYRGEFEKRLKKILSGIEKEEKPIVYIDEIHNLLGAGASGESSMDAANILKPYLSEGHIRFMGATTFEEYKKHFEKSKSLVRRFQNVEIKEPSAEETVKILTGLKKKYEKFHGVTYGKGVLEYAVAMSEKYINERFLPDKAIDLMDEAGAYRKIHPLEQKRQTVGKDLIDLILTSVCRVPRQTVASDELSSLETLEKRIKGKVFGQDEAVAQVVNAVKFSKAGLVDDGKPLASLLFVGPTGVGKTEIAKTLAAELGVKLVRFDMSEYTEKHSVAKLIGAPAGYVGYDEGGLLTEQIRKNPNSILLLDEIEKAHPDIFSTLLQVMDYATLTDNQGRKADFRNVVIIMTSNAGASRITKTGLGFQTSDKAPDTIMEEVKRVFQPEFRNRLTKIVVFRSLTEEMGRRIAEKKLSEVGTLLSRKKVEFSWSEEAVKLLVARGTSREYGAREIDRIISAEIKPLMADEILFGRLKKGGTCQLMGENGKFFCSFGKA